MRRPAPQDDLLRVIDVGLAVWEPQGSSFVVASANPAAERWLATGVTGGAGSPDARVLALVTRTAALRSPQALDGLDVGAAILDLRTHLLGGGLVGLVITDATAHHADRRRLGDAARHDALTGLATRAEFIAALDASLSNAVGDDTRLAVVVLDLDRFKDVNDTLGHTQGDLLLADVARRLSARRDDTHAVSRIGGDEFAVLVAPRVLSLEAVAARIASAFATPFSIGRLSIRATASVGVAAWPDHADGAEELLRKADVAMWAAKRSGRGVAVYRRDEDRYDLRRLQLISDLREAIGGDSLTLHYQPKLDLASARVVGAEALVRWDHPELGSVPPGEFVPIAEDSGLIGSLSHWVLGETARQLRAWNRLGVDLPSGVSANISARNLYDPELVRWLAEVFETHDLRPGELTLELTETQVAEDLPMARSILRRLQAVGARLSIDDFGTGYSSLAYLSKLPLDELKIDRSFVAELGAAGLPGASGAAVVQTIIGLAHELGLQVVAEGVESAAALEQLQALGCDQVQGDHVSPPLPVGEFEAWLLGGGPTRPAASGPRARSA